ncbi:hypothetical protein TNCV_953931 [Trichonephila clavipes]|nr:hypothetical protein TNCV_953931 [Trichonephila clavipes]
MSTKLPRGLKHWGLALGGPPDRDICSCTSALNGHLLQLEETTPSTTPYRDHHRGGPLRLPGGRKDALRESQKCNNERLNGKRMLYVIKEKFFHFDFR